MRIIPYSVSPEREQSINESIKEQCAEIACGLSAIERGSTRIALLQGVGRVEAACGKLTLLAKLIK